MCACWSTLPAAAFDFGSVDWKKAQRRKKVQKANAILTNRRKSRWAGYRQQLAGGAPLLDNPARGIRESRRRWLTLQTNSDLPAVWCLDDNDVNAFSACVET